MLSSPVFFDHVTERANTYAEDRYARGKENIPSEDEEGKRAWTPTTTQEILALVGCLVCMGMIKINNTADNWSVCQRTWDCSSSTGPILATASNTCYVPFTSLIAWTDKLLLTTFTKFVT
jgi:hypothetical protein